MDVRAFGSWMSELICLFSKDFEGLTEILTMDACPIDLAAQPLYPPTALWSIAIPYRTLFF